MVETWRKTRFIIIYIHIDCSVHLSNRRNKCISLLQLESTVFEFEGSLKHEKVKQ